MPASIVRSIACAAANTMTMNFCINCTSSTCSCSPMIVNFGIAG